MSLPVSQQLTLDRIEKALAVEHPGLEPLFGIFTRLAGHEAMPLFEQVADQPRRRRMRPGALALAGLAVVIGTLLTLSLLLPGPQSCSPGTVTSVSAQMQSVPAGHQLAC